MHAAVASQGVVNAMLAKYFEKEAAGKAEQSRLDTEYMQKAEADLQRGWGSSYDENVESANDFLSKLPDLVKLELRNGSLLDSHPAFVRQMAEVGRMSNEGPLKFCIPGTEMATDKEAR